MIKRKALMLASFLLAVSIILIFIFSQMTFGAEVRLAGKVFSAEVADTNKLLNKGLSGHEKLLDNQGMLFVFDKVGEYGFWMKDMSFPIDIIWIGPDFKVVHIEKSLNPETYPKIFYPNADSLYVFEVLAGTVEELNLKIGDTVKITKNWL